jgi:hypothetical protein
MKRLLMVCLMMTCSVSWAEWEFSVVGESDDFEITYYSDKSTIRRNGDIVKMWSLKEYSVMQKTFNGVNYKSSKVLNSYNCKYESSTQVSIVHYSNSMGNGNVVYTVTFKESELEWEPYVPGSLGQVLWKIACRKK